MALNITVDINGVLIESLNVQRMEPLRRLDIDSQEDREVVCVYKVQNNFSFGRGDTIRHRYGDGAAQLAVKVLKKYGRKAM
jgi:hypothetical protein